MEDLRLTFLIFGIVAIVAILVHGIWTIRKNAKGAQKAKLEARDWQQKSEPSLEDDEFDAHGIGSVRVVSTSRVLNSDADLDDDESVDSDYDSDKLSDDVSHDVDLAESTLSALDDEANVKSTNQEHDVLENELPLDDDLSLEKSNMDFAKSPKEPEPEEPKLYGSVVTQPKPAFQRSAKTPESTTRQTTSQDAEHIPEPPPFLLKSAAANPEVNPEVDNITKLEPSQTPEIKTQPEKSPDARTRVEPEFKLDAEQAPVEPAKPISLAAQARKLVSRRKKSVADVIRKEPEIKSSGKANEEQMRIDFSNDEPVEGETTAQQSSSQQGTTARISSQNATPTTTQQPTASTKNTNSASEQATDVLVLNVRAPEDREITGAALLPMLLTLGLKFGEQDIFHRHVNTNGKGPVLFSLANLFKPGVFDIDNIETFSTRGLSLFMMLPIEGDAQQVFNMMHNAARKLADEFGCQILDGSRGVLTKQGLQKYSERIREFERKRINR
jgi:cell division protein ZipA